MLVSKFISGAVDVVYVKVWERRDACAPTKNSGSSCSANGEIDSHRGSESLSSESVIFNIYLSVIIKIQAKAPESSDVVGMELLFMFTVYSRFYSR